MRGWRKSPHPLIGSVLELMHEVFFNDRTNFMFFTGFKDSKIVDFTEVTFYDSNRPIGKFDFPEFRTMNKV